MPSSFSSRARAVALGLALLAAPVVTLTATAKAAAPEVTQTVSYQGKSVTVRLNPVSVRGPAFEVLLQKADGTYAKQSAPAPRTFLGSVDGDSAAYASAIRTSTGKLSGQVVFDRGATWFFTDGAVTGTRGLTPPAEYRWPSASEADLNVTVTPGQIGGTTRRWDQAFDIDTSWYTTTGKSSVAVTLDAVEQAAVDMLATYESNALLRPALGRIVIRGSAARTPYTKDGLLGAVKTEWTTNHAGADWDATALVHAHSGGGVAWRPGVGDKNWGQSVNGGKDEFPTIVARHEIAHNWGARDNHTNGPEGPTIVSGNQYARFDGTELAAMMARRDAKLDKFPADPSAYPVALPPYASLDLADDAFSGVPIALRPTANDADANRNALTLKSVDATSKLGGRITRSGDEVSYVPPAVTTAKTTDSFTYVVRDSTGKTATGVVITRVSPNTALPPMADWKATDVITGVPYELVNQVSGLPAATPAGAPAGVPLVQRAGTDAGTRFTVTTQGEGYRLRNVATERCADVAAGSMSDGAKVIDYGCHSSANQQWRVLEHPDGGLAVVNVRSGKCLQPRGGALSAGTELTQMTCSHQGAQRWDLRAKAAPVDDWADAAPADTSVPYTLTNLKTGLRAAGANATDSMPGLVQRGGDDKGSRFLLARAASGGHTLRVQSTSGACMQVHYGSKDAGVDVTTWYCGDEADRRWQILANPAGGQSLRNVNSGLCLTATDPKDSGPDLVQQPCGITPESRWALQPVGGTAPTPTPTPTPTPPTRAAKSLIIGIDGATYSKLAAAQLPNITALQRAGTTSPSSLFANPMAPTLSGPGWTSIATGVWPDKHKVRDNAFTGAQFATYPDYLSRLEQANAGLSTLAVATWKPLVDTVFGTKVDRRVAGGSDANTTTQAVEALRSANPDSMFMQLDDVDHAGHAHGAASPEYLQALKNADERVGQLVAAVQSRASYSGEDWLIVLTSDHGQTDGGGHGGNSAQERETFVIARGGGNAAGAIRPEVKIVDIAPSVLAHHGVARAAAWGLDGLATKEISGDSFDALYPSLQAAVDETAGLPKGWTRTAPNGWSIDNSAMPSGGVTEWRGWSFATDEFWTGSQRGQGRETNVRARKVFAVADSDEWDDKSHAAGPFDSTLVSPAYDVAGRSSATVRFATTYAIDGPQSAQVLVSFDGGTKRELRSYTAPVNGLQQLDVPVPSGAKRMQVHFRYTGTNSAFWTVDQVTVDGAR